MKTKAGARRVAIIAALGMTVALGSAAEASHFSGSSANPSPAQFNPQFEVTLGAPIQDFQSDVTLRITQEDHEAFPRRLWVRVPADFDLDFGALRPPQQANGNPATSCTHPLGNPDHENLRHVQRAEIIGNMHLVVATDLTQPRSTPVVWDGDAYHINWDGSGAADICWHVTTRDQRVWDIYNTTGEDLRQLTFSAPIVRTNGWWEVFGDLESLASDSILQEINTSVWELTTSSFGRSRGNWGNAVPFFLTPAVSFGPEPIDGERWFETFTFEAEFHSCRNRPGETNPCGARAHTNRPDVFRRPEVRIYPSRLPPVVTQPAPGAILLGVEALDLAWEPHPGSYPAGDPVRGVSGWVATVVPFDFRDDPAVAAVHADGGPCPEVAIVCRDASDPIVPGVPEPDRGVLTSDPDGRTLLQVEAEEDGWNVYAITPLYADGTTSFDTDLISAPGLGPVRGPAIGQVYLGIRDWPFIYLGSIGLAGEEQPVLLFIDTFAREFSFVTPWWTAEGHTPLMYFFQSGTQTHEGDGAFSHVEGPPQLWLPYEWSLHGTFDADRARILFHSHTQIWPLTLVRAGADSDNPVGELVSSICDVAHPLLTEIQSSSVDPNPLLSGLHDDVNFETLPTIGVEDRHQFPERCPPEDAPRPPSWLIEDPYPGP